MSEIENEVASEIAETIETVIVNAEETAQQAAATNEMLVEAAIEGERGERIAAIERRLDEWQNNQEDSNQAIAALSLGMERITGQLEALMSLQSTPAQYPTPIPQSEEDGLKESHVEEIVAEPAAEVPAIPEPPAPKKKRHRWI